MRCLAVFLVLATGCDKLFGINELSDAGSTWPCVTGQPSTLVGTLCPANMPIDDVWAPTSLDTRDCGAFYDELVTHACLITARTIRIGAGVVVRFTGPDPVILYALEALSVDGTIDVASHGADLGAGASACMPSTATSGWYSAGGAGGGAGGTFGTAGGAGGQGGGPGAVGGVADMPTAIRTVRGGCPGGWDGNGYGAGGAGGGALYLVAGTSISVHGTINASGTHGLGGTMGKSGGSGGGSGGLIAFDAPLITFGASARVLANGGGGGGGASNSTLGDDGSDPDPASPLVPAAGGAKVYAGGGGTAGAMTSGGAGTSSNVGAGGGGGGAGYIPVFAAASGIAIEAAAAISPSIATP